MPGLRATHHLAAGSDTHDRKQRGTWTMTFPSHGHQGSNGPDAGDKSRFVRNAVATVAGYNSDSRCCHLACGRTRARGITNHIHAATWSATLSAKAV